MFTSSIYPDAYINGIFYSHSSGHWKPILHTGERKAKTIFRKGKTASDKFNRYTKQLREQNEISKS